MSGEPKTIGPNDAATCPYKCRIPQRLLAGRQRQPPKLRAPIIDPAKTPPVHRRMINEKNCDVVSSKAGRPVITVPVKQKCISKAACHSKLSANLPDQETIKKCEELELQQEDFSDAAQMYNNINESIMSQSDKKMQIKACWQEKIVQFDAMKNDLNNRQNGILEVYASLRNIKQKLMSMGQKADLPSTDDLRIMNVTNMTPDQLLQLCAESKYPKDDKQITKNMLTNDMKKFNEMLLQLVATCEQTLAAKKELIDWFENLKNQEKGCPKSSLSKKLNEFNSENGILSRTLQSVKNEFLKELNDFLRTCWNERVGIQLRNEELIYDVSELNSKNADLKKQLYNAEKQKSQINKIRIEELEKELKEEKVKKNTFRDRLCRAEEQLKIDDERVSLLEASLDQARMRTRTLEHTIQQLHEQKQQLQKDFDEELSKLKECMKKNTIHLEEIATARETLQQEKEDLEKRLEELSKHYNESLSNMKVELSKSIADLIDAEKKCNGEVEDKKKLQKIVESQCAQLLEYEVRIKDTLKQLQESDRTSNELLNCKKDFERTKYELHETVENLENHKVQNLKQYNSIMELEHNLEISHENEKTLKNDLKNKEEYISSLEKKQDLLQRKSQENECKNEIYEEQLTSLKCHLTKLQEHFAGFENLNELKDLVNTQANMLAETKRVNDELNEEKHKKQNDLKRLVEALAQLENIINKKQRVLQKLSEREKEQTNILQLNQLISDKNVEIESLITNIETRKEQISQLEKIILTLEDLNRKSVAQKRKDQDKIRGLEKRIIELEYRIASKNSGFSPSANIDNLIKILENELGIEIESQFTTTNR